MSRKIVNKVLRLSFLVTIAFLSAQIIVAQETSKIVEELDVQGNRRLKNKDILAHIVTRPGAILDRKQVEKDLAAILNLEVFDLMKTRVFIENGIRGGVNVIFEVKELPLIAKVSYSAPKRVSIQEIKNELKSHDLLVAIGQPYHYEKLRKLRKTIERYLARKNIRNVEVLFFENHVTATTVELHISIKDRRE